MHQLRLEKQVDFLAKHPDIGVVASKVCYKTNPGEPFREGFEEYVKWSNSVLEEYEISLFRFEESPIVHPSVVFRKMLFKSYGGYRDGAGEAGWPRPDRRPGSPRCREEAARGAARPGAASEDARVASKGGVRFERMHVEREGEVGTALREREEVVHF